MKKKIYLAGPLFCEAEVEQRLKEAKALRELGFEVYNPVEVNIDSDGDNTIPWQKAFRTDMEKIRECDYMVADVASEDSGTMAEIGIAMMLPDVELITVDSNFYKDTRRNLFIIGICRDESTHFDKFEDVLEYLG